MMFISKCLGFAKALVTLLAVGAVSLTFAQTLSVTIKTATVEEYSPFVVSVAASAPICFSAKGPLFSDAQLTGATLRLVATHVDSASCVSSREYTVPGLPAGTFTVQVVATRTSPNTTSGFISEIAAEGIATVRVAAVSQVAPVDIVTVESNLGFGFRNSETVQLFPPIVTAMSRLEGGANSGLPTRAFKAWQKSPTQPTVLPSAARLVTSLKYPGVRSTFLTINEPERDKLLAAGFSYGGEGGFWALPAVNGACAFGTFPVFRLFSQEAVMHRFTPSLALTNILAANGYVMELVSFCVPAL
jgi:hypothetical protein